MLQFNAEEKTAVIVIDMQNDFVQTNGAIPAEGALAIVPNIAKLLQAARRKGWPVIYTRESHRANLSDLGIELSFEPVHCLEGSSGEEIIEALQPEKEDYLITNKRRYDAFIGTDLALLLNNLGVKNIIFTGVCTDICVMSTVIHARNLDFKNCVLTDCTAGTTEERHLAAFKVLEHVFARVSDLADALRLFKIDAEEA